MLKNRRRYQLSDLKIGRPDLAETFYPYDTKPKKKKSKWLERINMIFKSINNIYEKTCFNNFNITFHGNFDPDISFLNFH